VVRGRSKKGYKTMSSSDFSFVDGLEDRLIRGRALGIRWYLALKW
jgi:hypothetical protein